MTKSRRVKKATPNPKEVARAEHPGPPEASAQNAPTTPLVSGLRNHNPNLPNKTDGVVAESPDDLGAAHRVRLVSLLEEFLVILKDLLKARQWSLIEEIRVLLCKVADLVRILPGLEGSAFHDAEAEIEVLRGQINTLLHRG